MTIKLSISLLCIVFLSAQRALLFAQAPLQKVTISYSSSGITSIEFFIAKEKQFFREAGLESRQLQALVSNAIQASAISPPWVLLGRDKYKMNILDSAIDKFASIQNGLAVSVKTLQDKPDLVKKLLRAKARAARYFEQNEREVSEMLAKMWNTDVAIALDSYRMSKPAFTVTGVPTEEEVREYLAFDAQILKLPQPVAPSSVFDFTIQREVNRELGIK